MQLNFSNFPCAVTCWNGNFDFSFFSTCSAEYLHSVGHGIFTGFSHPHFTFFHCYPVTFCLAPILRAAAAAARAAADDNSELRVQQRAIPLTIFIPATTSAPGDACSTPVSTATCTAPCISHDATFHMASTSHFSNTTSHISTPVQHPPPPHIFPISYTFPTALPPQELCHPVSQPPPTQATARTGDHCVSTAPLLPLHPPILHPPFHHKSSDSISPADLTHSLPISRAPHLVPRVGHPTFLPQPPSLLLLPPTLRPLHPAHAATSTPCAHIRHIHMRFWTGGSLGTSASDR